MRRCDYYKIYRRRKQEKQNGELYKSLLKKRSTVTFSVAELLSQVIGVSFYLIMCMLASVGIAVLINESMRNMLFEIVKNTFLGN